MVLTYSILEKERRDTTIWCKVEYYIDGNNYVLDVPSSNPQVDLDVYNNIVNAGISHHNKILDEKRIDDQILPIIEA